MKIISVNDFENFLVGSSENKELATGCTVILCEDGAACGLDVRGGGPASRESELLKPVAAADKIHAVLLSGGSAFSLGAANGVMKYLSEKNIGFETGIKKVPLVCQSAIFDLGVGSADAYPDQDMAYEACKNTGNYKDGNFGVGTGASVGKLLGAECAMKAGVGSFAVQTGELKVGAIVAVNALGDVYEKGEIIAGLYKDKFLDSTKCICQSYEERNLFTGNTCIGVVITNARFDKTAANKLAAMASCGMVRAINPVNTTADGDSVYAMCCGNVEADINAVGVLAAEVFEQAVINAAKSAEAEYGLPSYQNVK